MGRETTRTEGVQLAILGAGGMQAQAIVSDWLGQPDVAAVRAIDSDPRRLDALRARFPDARLEVRAADAADPEGLGEAIAGCGAVLSSVPYFLNLAVTRAAIRARAHMVDLGGNTDVVFQQRALDEEAREAGVTVLPDQGLAPGLAGILAAHGMRGLDEVDSVRMRVGGLPQRPRGALGYALVFSIHGLLNEYAGEAVVLEDGEIARRPTLTGLEPIRFPRPVNACEAAYTSGGTSTLPWTFRGRVRALDYKTVRYPGHWAQVALLKELGFLETAPTPVGRAKVPPREMLAALLEPRLTDPHVRDLVVLRVRVRGVRGGRPCLRQYDLLDLFDEASGLTAMMRTTGFPAAESALLLARGLVPAKGVPPAETAIPGDLYIEALRRRGLRIVESETEVRG